MTRFQENKQKIIKAESEICPKVLKRLHREKTASSRWLACLASHTQFEVKNGLQSFTMDLEKGNCSLRLKKLKIYVQVSLEVKENLVPPDVPQLDHVIRE